MTEETTDNLSDWILALDTLLLAGDAVIYNLCLCDYKMKDYRCLLFSRPKPRVQMSIFRSSAVCYVSPYSGHFPVFLTF